MKQIEELCGSSRWTEEQQSEAEEHSLCSPCCLAACCLSACLPTHSVCLSVSLFGKCFILTNMLLFSSPLASKPVLLYFLIIVLFFVLLLTSPSYVLLFTFVLYSFHLSYMYPTYPPTSDMAPGDSVHHLPSLSLFTTTTNISL